MAACRVCGVKAEWVVEKSFHVFRVSDRHFCERHYRASVRRQDVFLGLFVLISAGLLATALFYRTTVESRTIAQAAADVERVFDERDFDKDGYLDLWETQATPRQIQTFQSFLYPWETVQGQTVTSKTVLATMDVARFKSIYETRPEVRAATNFPSAMDRFLAAFTDPNSSIQIDRVVLTTERDLAVTLRKYESPPSSWPPSTSSKKGKKTGSDVVAGAPVLDAWFLYENLSKKEGLLLANAFGVKPADLPFAYQNTAP